MTEKDGKVTHSREGQIVAESLIHSYCRLFPDVKGKELVEAESRIHRILDSVWEARGDSLVAGSYCDEGTFVIHFENGIRAWYDERHGCPFLNIPPRVRSSFAELEEEMNNATSRHLIVIRNIVEEARRRFHDRETYHQKRK